ncbi:CDC45 family [Protomyces lactucae-debilis]|uniref:CDC45 family n=1 Tax=Protomyces lactucae-debilis TaxID=2754530 RepID=A0A1Y2FNA1_PROLT|nr:CDC45 family [Protomyces lactucae-debilis]ORY85462.1 CDC45 family [Protomyces lactucae-debilis]
MIIRRDQFAEAYGRFKTVSLSGTCAVLILVALDVDALCATKMLCTMLRNDYIPHKIHPVAGWNDLKKANDAVVQNQEDLKFIVLMNFGAFFDPLQHLSVDESMTIYVIDSHKPVMMENLYFESNVYVWDDGTLERQTDVAQAFAEWHEEEDRIRDEEERGSDAGEEDEGLGADEEAPEEEEEEQEQEEQDDQESRPGTPTRRKRRSSSGSPHASGSDAGDFSGSEDSDEDGPRQRRKTSRNSHVQPSPRRPVANAPDAIAPVKESANERRRRHQRNANLLADYYDRGDWYGESIAGLMYGLASDLGREDNDLLWHAIVGLTSLTIQSRITLDTYASLYRDYKDEVTRLNPPTVAPANALPSATVKSPSDFSIRAESEYRFMLFRHWSLHDAMLHSPYLGAKMKVYSQAGQKNLAKLFAKMGMSLTQCRQMYTHMDMDLKHNLRVKLTKFAPQYGLDELTMESFVRHWGYKCTLSASDVCYALTALLESGTDTFVKNGHANLGHGHKPATETTTRTEQDKDATENGIREEWVTNFYEAYDAMDHVDALRNALHTSMDLQRAIVATGTALIDKREIRSLRSFRMAVVREGPHMRIFTHPLALAKLAHWIAGALDESNRERGRTKHLPFVIACLDERTDRYLVLGTSVTSSPTLEAGAAEAQGEQRNKFGHAFQLLSANHQARFRLDSFDASIVECEQGDLGPLLETLSQQVLL